MLLYLLDLCGVAVFAVSGAIVAARRRLDVVGVLVVACVTAVGGGTLRDVLLDRHPIAWLADPTPFVVVLVAALGTVLWTRAFRPPWYAILVADALGLALFSVSGAQIAERSGVTTVLGVVVLGTMTGVAGGVLRDLLSAEIPLVLRRGNLYASAAIAVTLVYRLLEIAGVPTQAAAFTGMAIVAGVRFAAIRWRLSLPTYSVPAQTDEYPAPRSRTGRGPRG